ncbi:hypothetical protein [Micromonospora sp. WMMD1082]|uniref:hypothetical protein n=1 Tax=Micromonospora sp. WMMD1082 TaxID=3016104 RepID=UPI002417E356|nr:hypothetical protein [Micromonospora sp. WMMD1082]MDG4793038.1 hypothetical protein [Micromonospora sp. WMMD1082]
MHRPIPTLRGTLTHTTAVELYQRHHPTATEACARCGRTPCPVRTFAASVIAAAGEIPSWYDTPTTPPALAGTAPAEPRQPERVPGAKPKPSETPPEHFGHPVGRRDVPLDAAEGLLYEREY